MNSISLCMIVKDEEDNIQHCLKSVYDIVDEIIIVDTGSTDKTRLICSKFKSKIYDYQWSNDFGKARNFSINKATSDWILWMDADEEMIVKEKEIMKNCINDKDINVYSVKMLHVYGSELECDKEYHISYNSRLFRNRMKYYFDGEIHEKLITDEETVNMKVCSFMEIMHYGYTKKYMDKKEFRNLEILTKQKEKGNKDPWIDYHIAVELYKLNDLEKAFWFVNQSIAGFLIKSIMPPAIAYKLKYDILIHMNSMENAYKGIEHAIRLYPDYVELHFYKGIILYNLQHYEDAILSFKHCLVLGENNSKYLITAGVGGFNTYYYIGECYEKIKKYEYAQQAYSQSLLLNPSFSKAKFKLTEKGMENEHFDNKFTI